MWATGKAHSRTVHSQMLLTMLLATVTALCTKTIVSSPLTRSIGVTLAEGHIAELDSAVADYDKARKVGEL